MNMIWKISKKKSLWLVKNPDPEHTVPHLMQAIEFYQGPFLPELEDSWIVTAREHLHQNYLEILMKLSRHFLAEKDFYQSNALQPARHYRRSLF